MSRRPRVLKVVGTDGVRFSNSPTAVGRGPFAGAHREYGPFRELAMMDSKTLAQMIPALRVTYDSLSKTLPEDPVARYMRELLAKILALLEGDDGPGAGARPGKG